MLFAFYYYCHPWVSEGISVGFEASQEKNVGLTEGTVAPGENDNNSFSSPCLTVNSTLPPKQLHRGKLINMWYFKGMTFLLIL